jgi:hypothetical protein
MIIGWECKTCLALNSKIFFGNSMRNYRFVILYKPNIIKNQWFVILFELKKSKSI